MSFVGKIVVLFIGVTALVAGFCLLNLRCSGKPSPESTYSRVTSELAAGKREARNLQADDLARLAHDLRVLAARYKEQGENKKAHRAIGAAQELDKKIRKLREAKEERKSE